ncbi:F-box domain containing protein [Melia azedarach]|uniref:F-box domain containing protein n=1 Tax=Melia azedarach TaxID=155640 RepID=A0ACC1XKJ5_MELAZ|nr:F-box domain containing protein [Melia azedarach]
MGNCVSLHKNTDMKLAVQIQSPNKDNTVISQQHIAVGHTPQMSAMERVPSFPDLSSKEEIFLDSQPWLESDCEDYFSVNGDLPPSHSNSPIHQKSFIEAPQLDKIPPTDSAPDSIPPSSPTDMKKQLIDLFRESFNDAPADGNQNLQGQKEAKPTTLDYPPKFASRSPYELEPNSVRSSEATPYRGSYHRKENSAQSAQCCIPSFMRNLSFSERKKRLSPSSTNIW